MAGDGLLEALNELAGKDKVKSASYLAGGIDTDQWIMAFLALCQKNDKKIIVMPPGTGKSRVVCAILSLMGIMIKA